MQVSVLTRFPARGQVTRTPSLGLSNSFAISPKPPGFCNGTISRKPLSLPYLSDRDGFRDQFFSLTCRACQVGWRRFEEASGARFFEASPTTSESPIPTHSK